MQNVLIAGGSGLIGSRLSELFLEKGYAVSILSRKNIYKNNIIFYQWNPASGFIDNDAIKNADFIINLAGEGIADKAWTTKRKEEIVSSRVDAAKTIFTANIMGGGCSKVCPVEKLCEGACVYNLLHETPIHIAKLQRYSTEQAIAQKWKLFTLC